MEALFYFKKNTQTTIRNVIIAEADSFS